MTLVNAELNSLTGKYLFHRSYAVTLAPQGQAAGLQYGTLGDNPAPLRVRFDIDKNSIASSNKSKIEVFNLSQESRQNLKKGFMIKLEAGYKDLFETLFLGNVVNPTSKREGADIITSMECGDGEAAIVFSTLDKSYPAGTKLFQILQDLASSMGLNTGVTIGLPNKVFNNGFVATGKVSDNLTKLLQGLGLEWHVQNGNLNIIPLDAHDGSEGILISAATGMIGVPSSNSDFVQFTSLLNPRLSPGSLVQLVSENTQLNGYYKIRRSHYEGDSHDTKWQVSCEAVPISPNQKLPSSEGDNFATAVE